MSFNTSGRKEDISLKLKAQNLHNAQLQTKQLEMESQKMEERLYELKMAMNREKEEREQQGGGFWQSGKTGALISYGKDAVNKPASSKPASGKRRRVKVLKDEPIVVPERNKPPGTMAHIASREASGKNSRQKGPRCGQCEQKIAHVSCLECCEDYCAGCFAAFHLRGALKKHRSVPVGSNGSRHAFSPKPTAPASRVSSARQRNNKSPRSPRQIQENLTPADLGLSVLAVNGSSRKSPVGASRSFEGPSLLEGKFDEDAGKASFQDALKAWRTGKGSIADNDKHDKVMPKKEFRQVTSTEHGTSTETQEKIPIEIRFKSGLTYAEKLLLKKHRRADIKPLHVSPRQTDTRLTTPRNEQFDDGEYWPHLDPVEMLRSEWEEEEDPEHARFEARRRTIAPHDSGMDDYRPDSRISIIELQETDQVPRRIEKSSSYQVTEQDVDVQPYSAWSVIEPREAFVSPSVTPRVSVSRSTTGRPGSKTYRKSENKENTERTDYQDRQVRESVRNSGSATKRDIQNAHRPNSRTKVQKSQKNMEWQNNQESDISGMKIDSNKAVEQGKRPKSSAKSRPVSRTESRGPSRAGSRMSRPASRTKSRASSRLDMFGEGNLTKAPSNALKEIARLHKEDTLSNVTLEYQNNLGDFFTAGAMPNPNEERVLTPTSQKKKQDGGQTDRYRISNKIYQITPRSWRPDSSLGEKVPDVEAQKIVNDTVTGDYEQFMSAPENGLNSENTLTWTWSQSVADMSQQQSSEPRVSSSFRDRSSSSRSTHSLSSSQTKLTNNPAPKPVPSLPKSTGSRVNTPVRPVSASGRESRMIVMDGQDLSEFDDVGGEKRKQEREDEDESLYQLEYELASQDGRITADGKISRASMLTPEIGNEEENEKVADWKPDRREGFDISHHLRESELMDDFEEMEKLIMAEEVKSLR